MIAAYTRVSSHAQNFATQKDAIERLAAVREDTIAAWENKPCNGVRRERKLT
jgi:DNA invertase Pin-like site-specific DNA recombinase